MAQKTFEIRDTNTTVEGPRSGNSLECGGFWAALQIFDDDVLMGPRTYFSLSGDMKQASRTWQTLLGRKVDAHFLEATWNLI